MRNSSIANVLLANDTTIDMHHGCTAVMSSLEALLSNRGLNVVARIPAHFNYDSIVDFERLFEGVDLVVINGEGTVHDDCLAGSRLVEFGVQAKRWGKRVVFLNSGWYNNSRSLTELLSKFDLVAMRDSASADAVREFVPSVLTVPDLSLLVNLIPETSARIGVAFTDNVNRYQSLKLAGLRKAFGGVPLSIHKKGGFSRVSFLRLGVSLRQDFVTPIFAGRLIAERNVFFNASLEKLEDFLTEISRVELLVSGRFHACTLAILCNTPFISQASNTPKIKSLCQDIGLESWRYNEVLTLGNINDALAKGWSPLESEARLAYLNKSAECAKLLMDDVVDLI